MEAERSRERAKKNRDGEGRRKNRAERIRQGICYHILGARDVVVLKVVCRVVLNVVPRVVLDVVRRLVLNVVCRVVLDMVRRVVLNVVHRVV